MNPCLLVTLSQHAARRSAQRAIPHAIVDALLAVGVRDHDHRGRIRVHVHQHRSKRRFIARLGRDAGERFSNCYCVIDSQTGRELITVGWMSVDERLIRNPRIDCARAALGRRLRLRWQPYSPPPRRPTNT